MFRPAIEVPAHGLLAQKQAFRLDYFAYLTDVVDKTLHDESIVARSYPVVFSGDW